MINQILIALNIRQFEKGIPMYEGTVPDHVVAARRRKNKAARKARRVHRSR